MEQPADSMRFALSFRDDTHARQHDALSRWLLVRLGGVQHQSRALPGLAQDLWRQSPEGRHRNAVVCRFPGLESYDTPTELAVYTLPRGTQVQVPSFETWFRLLDQEFGDTGAYPLAAQAELAVTYSRLRRNEDVVGAFHALTGCRRAALLRGQDPSPKIGCNRAFLGAIAAAGPSPYTTGKSKSCFRNFASRYRGPKNAAAMLGVLYQCQDVGFLNTGVGLGYNTYANPFVCKAAAKQTVLQKYTGREFILPNMTFNDLPSYVNIGLDLGKPSRRGFLYSGYCRISGW